ncbi:MAG: prephenate dehydratase [Clostridia bacterium]|nr:prephenate dehydratase [Clostridia bacterium]
MKSLEELRQGIDRIDKQLLELFAERMDFCSQVADYKRSVGMPILDVQREKEVLAAKMEMLKNPELKDEVYAFFSGIMAISRNLQKQKLADVQKEDVIQSVLSSSNARIKNPRVCYFGASGSYSEGATMEYFGTETQRFPVDSFAGVLETLTREEADYGVLPIENSSTGSIAAVLDLLGKYGCSIVGEVNLAIHHCLLGKKGTELSKISKVYSHEQGILQSQTFLNSIGSPKTEVCHSTAQSAKLVAELEDVTVAAIAGKQNATIYGLEILAENINSSEQNMTRFAVVAKCPEITEECDKISIVFTLPHESGELHRVMSCFARGGLNLLKLESRPIPNQRFEYMFFVDYTGNLLDEKVRQVTDEVIAEAQEFKLLGNYPAGAMGE